MYLSELDQHELDANPPRASATPPLAFVSCHCVASEVGLGGPILIHSAPVLGKLIRPEGRNVYVNGKDAKNCTCYS